ncbi:CCA tRNA nucleotidyltransferase [Nibricoccus sp. IMCC34717]|uniref:CCA tRNA nucleotidyltransferase n=1 Tax=Nibricoccus sp. IMCC34717 TaxID=3034021 RepID=UPI00384F3F54
MRIPAELITVLNALRNPGRPRLVGGSVRDWLLGLEPKDFDVEVPGMDFEELLRRLEPFGSTDIVGRSFGVIKLRLGGNEYDFSLPRRESKVGAGHRGFAVAPEPNLTDEEALARRDFTVNALAWEPFEGRLIDPFGGEADLRARVLRHTSAAFSEDPLRVLRGFQLAGRFDFKLAEETIPLCRSIHSTYPELAIERVWAEWAKWAEKAEKPSAGLKVLHQTRWLSHFPEIAALDGTQQDPQWHPEGDVWAHTLYCCDALARLTRWRQAGPELRRVLLLAVLCHDLGKVTTTFKTERNGTSRWTSHGHEQASGPLCERFLKRIGAPAEVIDRVKPLVLNHHAHFSGKGGFTLPAVRRLARRLAPSSIEELCVVMRADHDGRPPLYSEEALTRIALLLSQAESMALQDRAPKPLVHGRDLLALGYEPGPKFKWILDAAFEAQLDGAFSDADGGVAWVRSQKFENSP